MAARNQDVEGLGKLIESIDTTMFTTIGAGGALVSRPLSTQKAEFDGERVWFFVESDSPKVAEIRRNRQVNLAYASKGKNTYVSMSGEARLSNDRARKEQFWNDGMKAFFPGGIDDPKLALIEVTVRTAEYWDGPGTLVGKAIAFAIARVTKREEVMGENRIIDLTKRRRTAKLSPSHADAKRGAGASAKRTAKKAPAKRGAAKKSATTSTAKKTVAKRGSAAAKTPVARKSAAKKTSPGKAATKPAATRRTAVKRSAAKKAPAKKAASEKAASRR